MKKTSYKGKETKDLVKALYEKREELRNFRFGTTGAKSTNTKEGRNLRKSIARILTELNAK
ncbi:MAG: 50S ribosomal protein L29 [Parcubacteria group bacterium]